MTRICVQIPQENVMQKQEEPTPQILGATLNSSSNTQTNIAQQVTVNSDSKAAEGTADSKNKGGAEALPSQKGDDKPKPPPVKYSFKLSLACHEHYSELVKDLLVTKKEREVASDVKSVTKVVALDRSELLSYLAKVN
jgi:hypothetical protein